MQQAFLDRHFHAFTEFIFEQSGIRFGESKRQQLETKIRKAMNRSGFQSFEQYFDAIQQNEPLYQVFINMITTNTTEFFREKDHFDYIVRNLQMMLQVNPRILKNKELRLWCAASSTGQEPVSLAIQFRELLPYDIQLNILATDINSDVLIKAIRGEYKKNDCASIPKEYRDKYFRDIDGETVQVREDILQCIRYRRFNLMSPFSFKSPFDIIFCRNVMIYFPQQVQRELVDKFYHCLVPSGYLFVGHTESLLNKKNAFKSMATSVYIK